MQPIAQENEQTDGSILYWQPGGQFALAFAALLFRLYRLDEFPPGISQDEGAHGADALQVLQGEHAVFFPRHGGREGMVVYTVALATFLLGRTILATHLPTALASAGTVLVIFWLGRQLFDKDEYGRATPWRGLVIGGVGAGLLAVSLSQTFIGRSGVRANFLPLFLSLCFALLWSGWKQGIWWRVALAGACAGLLAYTYIPARLTPLLFLVFGLSFLPSLIKNVDRGGILEKDVPSRALSQFLPNLRAHLPMIVIFVGVAGLVAAPILLYFALHPEHFFMRSDQLLIFKPHRSQGDPLGTLLNNVWKYVLAFGFRGDWSPRHNNPGVPMLNTWEAFFFWFGVGMAGWRWRGPVYRFLLFWLVVLLLPAVIAKESSLPPPSFLRMIGVVPAVYLLIGVGLWEAFQLLEKQYSSLKDHTNLYLLGNTTRIAIVSGIAVAGIVLVQGVGTYRTYFQQRAVSPEYYRTFQEEWIEAVRVLSVLPSDAGTVYLLPYKFDENYGFEYLYQGTTPAYVIHAQTLDLPFTVGSTLTAVGNINTVKVIDWKEKFSWSAGDSHLVDLLGLVDI